MSKLNRSHKKPRSDESLSRMIAKVAAAAKADAIICATETGAFALLLNELSAQIRIIGATTNKTAYDEMIDTGMEALVLPLRATDKYSQVRHVISVALRSTTVSVGDLVVCAFGRNVYQEKGDFVVVTDVEPSLERLSVSDFLKLTDAIEPKVLELAIAISCRIGRVARSGKHIGAIIMLGDSIKVLEHSKQLIPNPFQGHAEANRRLTNPDTHSAIIELSKLDGAFVIRGDGLIQTAGTFLTSPDVDIEMPPGLGARHLAAAAVTKRTKSTAVVVSATDGNVRAFSGGAMVLHLDPDVPYGPVSTEM